MDNLKAFVNAEGNYDGLMDIGLYYENLKNRSVLSDIWKTVRTALKKGDAAALKSAATMAVIMVDSEYTDILRLSSSNENGSMSYFVNNLGKNEEEN